MTTQIKNILVVEDEDAHFELIKRVFDDHSEQFNIFRAKCLKDIEPILSHQEINIVLLDWVLPDGKAVEIINKEKYINSFPFIIMTSYGTHELAVEVLKYGAMDYIVKDFDNIYNLHNIITKVLREWEYIQKAKSAEKELLKSEEKYRTLIENLPIGIFKIEENGKILQANNSLISMLKLDSFDELDTYNIYNFIDRIQEIRDYIEILKNKNESNISFETELITKHGDRIWSKCTLNYIENGENEKYFTGSVEDISKQRITEKALINSELKYRRIFENLQDIYFESKIDGTISELNNSIYDLTGVERNQLIGNNLSALFAEENQAELLINYVLNNTVLSDYEVRIKSVNHQYLVCSINAMVISDELSNQIRIIGSIRDITYRKQNEMLQVTMFQISNAANISLTINELYKSIIELLCQYLLADNAFISFFETSGSLNYSFIHRKFELRKDLPAIDSIAKYIKETEEPILWHKEHIIEMVEKKKIEQFINIPFSILAVPFFKDNSIFGVIALISYNNNVQFFENDINIVQFASNQIALSTEKMQKNDEINNLNSILEQKVIERTAELKNAYNELKRENIRRKKAVQDLEKTKFELEISLEKEKELGEIKTRFISMISHEYRTPLTIIMSSVELIRISLINNQFRKMDTYITKIEQAVSSLTELLENVLHIDNTNFHSVTVNLQIYNMIELTSGIIDKIRNIDQSKHKINFLYQNPKIFLKTDAVLYRHIITNLLENAVKYSPEFSEIEVSIFNFSDKVQLTISDHGIGIPDKEISNLFDPFFRCTNIGNISGTGLGLSIVKKFVNALGAYIYVKSKEKVGTAFIIEFPSKVLI